MTGKPPGVAGTSPSPAPVVVVSSPSRPERTLVVADRLFIGRTCHGIDEAHRLLISGSKVSRDHCQIHVDGRSRRATLVDTSTNGTRLNGGLVERSVPVPLRDGDVIAAGDWRIVFQTTASPEQGHGERDQTVRLISEGQVCIVCGDLVNYTALTQLNGGSAVFAAMHTLFDRLRVLLHAHRGTLYDYVGDAFLAMWEESALPDAARRGVEFAVAAAAEIAVVAPSIPLRGPDGAPLRMGWAVTYGPVAMSAYAGSLTGVLGDAVNVGFRLASTAGRDGRAAVVVTDEAWRAGATAPDMGNPEAVVIKGHVAPVTIREVRTQSGC